MCVSQQNTSIWNGAKTLEITPNLNGLSTSMHVGRGQEFETFSKKGCFSSSSHKTQISPL